MASSLKTLFCIYPTGPHEWRWHLMDSQERVIALAASHYRTEEECITAVSIIKQSIHSPVEITDPSRPKRFL